jgi:hypothetical protein
MSQIKKVFITLVLLVLVFPAGVNAGFSFGFDSEGNWGFSAGSDSGSGSGGGSIGDLGLPGGSIFGIVENITYWLLGIFAFFGVIGFIVSGIMYLISTGDDDMIGKAKKYMLYSIVGVIVGLMGMVILQAAFTMLGAGGFF